MELLNPMADSVFAAQSASFTGTAGSVTGWPAGPQAQHRRGPAGRA